MGMKRRLVSREEAYQEIERIPQIIAAAKLKRQNPLITLPYTHPGNPEHVMRVYRRTCLAAKRNYGSSRALVHGMDYILEYLAAKRLVVLSRKTGK